MFTYQDHKPERIQPRKPMISITRNAVLGTTIVFRSPLSRRWLGNVTLAPSKKDTVEIETRYADAMAKAGLVLTLIAVMVAWGMR